MHVEGYNTWSIHYLLIPSKAELQLSSAHKNRLVAFMYAVAAPEGFRVFAETILERLLLSFKSHVPEEFACFMNIGYTVEPVYTGHPWDEIFGLIREAARINWRI